ncbi:MAG TPA: phosphoenolpyruvate kinase [Acidobacteriota bacterium]|nr:phosphoenolpyruvate kinase [Acidobacteriota bacterium]
MKRSFDDHVLDDLGQRLRPLTDDIAERYPGEPTDRQPVHTVYGGAQLFRSGTARRLGDLALRELDRYAPDAAEFGDAIGLRTDDGLREVIYERVRDKLETEPVEDFRIDFEDGYGNRPDDEEDASAVAAAEAVADGMGSAALPPFIGLRIKPLAGELYRRSISTLDIFVSTLLERTGGQLPDGFMVTLPKVMDPAEVAIFVDVLEQLELTVGLETGSLRLELMIETPQSIIAGDGSSMLPALVNAARGRCVGAHFGVYDYTAAAGISAQYQVMDHPACDFARHMMKVALAGTGVMLSDGATNVIPVAAHRVAADIELTQAQAQENRAAFHSAWKVHYEHVRHSLRHGFYQGWDLNPAQLPTRYAAVYAFFLENVDAASQRLRNFVSVAAQATLVGEVFDDAATGQGLLNFFLRGLGCGALSEAEVLETGLSLDELRGRSFAKILAGRRGEPVED